MLSLTLVTTPARFQDSDIEDISKMKLDECLLQIRHLQMNRQSTWQSGNAIAKKVLTAWAFSHYHPEEAEDFMRHFSWIVKEPAHA